MTNGPAFANFAPPIRTQSPLRRAITAAYRRDEKACLAPLLEAAAFDSAKKDEDAS
jgi:RHH-type transcriptional regulator, proline utilization regulon repressor / proline dehydrogenase / delta 1-pyrroline-5-carboxylate dehydrogenase